MFPPPRNQTVRTTYQVTLSRSSNTILWRTRSRSIFSWLGRKCPTKHLGSISSCTVSHVEEDAFVARVTTATFHEKMMQHNQNMKPWNENLGFNHCVNFRRTQPHSSPLFRQPLRITANQQKPALQHQPFQKTLGGCLQCCRYQDGSIPSDSQWLIPPFWSPNPTWQRPFHILPVSPLLPCWLGTLAGSTSRFQRVAWQKFSGTFQKVEICGRTASKSNMTTCCLVQLASWRISWPGTLQLIPPML